MIKLADEENLKPSGIPTKETIVLRTKFLPQDIMGILDKKKTSFFGSALRRPKSGEITIENPQLYLEQFVFISGHYEIDFDRNTSYMIKVDPDVVEVTIGNEKFPILNESGVWKKFGKKMKQGVGITKQNLRLDVVENALKSMTDSVYFDHNGLEIELPFKIDSKNIENYPSRILDEHHANVKKPEFSYESALDKLKIYLKKPLEGNIRDLKDEFTLHDITEVYIPIFEARLSDLKKKVEIIRIDAVRKKIL